MSFLNGSGFFAVAIGTAPVPEIIFSIGTAVNIACVLTKIQSLQNFQKPIFLYLFISQLRTRDLTSVLFQFISVGMGGFSIWTVAPRSHYQAKSNQ